MTYNEFVRRATKNGFAIDILLGLIDSKTGVSYGWAVDKETGQFNYQKTLSKALRERAVEERRQRKRMLRAIGVI